MTYYHSVNADSPIAWWRMETTSRLDTVSGSNTSGSGTPTLVPGVDGGTAWSLNQDVVIAPGFGFNDYTADNVFTIEAWFKCPPSNTVEYPTIWRRDGNGKAALIRMRGNNVSDPGKIEVYLAGSTIYTPNRYDDNQWHHIVVSANGAGADLLKVYIDGVQTNSATMPNLGSLATSGTRHYIGAGESPANAGEGFIGLLDEVAIYDKALTLAQAQSHYNSGYGNYDVTVGPTYDSAVTISTGVEASPTSGTMAVTSTQLARVRFSKAALFGSDNPSITSAKLRMTLNVAPTAAATVTPDGLSGQAKSLTTAMGAGTVVEFDVASLIESTVGDTVTIDLRRTAGTGTVTFSTSENTTVARRPVLGVQYTVITNVDKSVAAGVMTATAAAGDSTGRGNSYVVVSDTFTTNSADFGGQNSTHGADTILRVSSTGSAETSAYIKFGDVVAPGSGESIGSAKVRIYFEGATSGANTSSLKVGRITSVWNAVSMAHSSGRPTVASATTKTVAPPLGGGWLEIDISDIVAEWVAGQPNHGIRLDVIGLNNRDFRFTSSEGTNKPALVVQYSSPSVTSLASPMVASGVLVDANIVAGTGKTVAAEAITVTSTMIQPAVSTAIGASINVPVAYASALMTDAQVVQTQNPTLEVEPMLASATLTTGGGFESPRTVAAQAMVAEAALLEAGTYVEKGARITSAPMRATVAWVKPTGVNGNELTEPESEDAFFRRVVSLEPAGWTRLNDKGRQMMNRWGLDTNGNRVPKYAGYYSGGVFTGRNDAPEGRHSVYFDGTGMIVEDEGGLGGVPVAGLDSRATIVFSIRTTKQNQFLMVESDPVAGTNSSTTYPPKELYIKNGKLNYRGKERWDDPRTGNVGYTWDFQGHIPVADGQWHTIAIVSKGDLFGTGLEMYVDGKLDVRRGMSGGWAGYPDFIGSRPERLNPGTTDTNTLPALPSSQNYVGDMSEIVTFSYPMGETELARLYYDFMGWNPIFPAPAEAFAFAPDDVRAKGNQKRVLYLWWDRPFDAQYQQFGDVVPSQGARHSTMNFDPVLDGHGNMGIYNLEDYKVFSRGIMDSNRFTKWENGWYRDEVTDERRLIDLDKDIDFGDYDVIMIGDWPDEGWEYEQFGWAIPNFQRRKDDLVEQILDKVAEGKGLLVTQPRLAVDLGIVDRVEYASPFREGTYNLMVGPGHPLVAQYGNAAGLYDYGSAVKFPWDIAESAGMEFPGPGVGVGQPMNTDPEYLRHKAHFYGDMNWNNRFRVVGLQQGITDIDSWWIEDTVYHLDKDIWGDSLTAYKYKHRPNGLAIGDSFVYHGTDDGAYDYLISGSLWQLQWLNRTLGTWATPPGHVTAGTVLTTFDEKFWHQQELIDNPYKDYATTIVLKEGDTLRGRKLNGRIFVNFTEQPNNFRSAYPVDVLPDSQWDKDGSADWAHGVEETEAQKGWQYSDTRMKAFTTSITKVAGHTIVNMPDGSQKVVRTSVAAQNLFAVNYSRLYDRDSVPVIPMIQRGIWWIGNTVAAEPGGKTVGASPMIAQAKMGEAVLYAERDGGYTAEPARALAQMTRVKESTIGDVEIHTLPATASATFTGFNRTISPVPMTARAEFPENLSMVFAEGEQVVLTLHGVDTTLYLKEEA